MVQPPAAGQNQRDVEIFGLSPRLIIDKRLNLKTWLPSAITHSIP